MAKKKSRNEKDASKVTEQQVNNADQENETPENEANKTEPVAEAQAEAPKEEQAEEAAAPLSEEDQLKAELEASKKRAQEATDQYVRLLAEFDNFRKRTRREMTTQREYASENVLTALLPVLDDFARSLTAMEKTDNLSSMKEGLKMVSDKLHRVLEKEGLNAIESTGKPFDSELHEAIHSVEVPEEEKKGSVLEEVEKGYRLKDKVIRYSKVIVGE